MTKFCIICGKLLTGRQIKLCSDKECYKKRKYERELIYHQNNLKKIKEYQKGYQHDYYQNNRERWSKHNREYYQNNRENLNKRDRERKRERYQNDPEFRKSSNKRDHEQYRRSRGLPEDCDLRKESSIEKIMRGWLEKFNIEFIEQYYINLENSTWTRVDFYIPELNICLYVDGNYWHSLPERQESDIRINKALEEMRYKIIRMTETEILEGNRPELVLTE
jgi:very-short-patch-repair endonuclease